MNSQQDAKEAEFQAALNIAYSAADVTTPHGPLTRDQYEVACAALGTTPAADEAMHHGSTYSLNLSPARDCAAAWLKQRRIAGMHRERDAAVTDARTRLAAASLEGFEDPGGALSPYIQWSRDEYERACEAAGITARTETACAEAMMRADAAGGNASLAAIGDTDALPALNRDPVAILAVTLAIRRAYGMEAEALAATPADPCDECGTLIPAGTAMMASLGRACSPSCYDAMADLPGRHATRKARQ